MPYPFEMPIVYLDLNHWINMAQGIKKGGSPLFDRLTSLAQQKKIAIPASGVLLMELLAVKNPEQRKDVGAVIRQLTDRFIIRDFDNVLRMEITNSVVDHYGEGRRFTLPIMAFGVGYLEAFGHVKLELRDGAGVNSQEAAEVLDGYREILEGSSALDTMLEKLNIPKIQEGSGEHQALIEATRGVRESSSGKSFAAQEREYIGGMAELVSKYFGQAVSNLGVLVDGLPPAMPAKFRTTSFLESIPLIHNWSHLNLYLYHKNTEMKVEVNDLYDIGHLAVAIPYCDVVVCDKKMASVVSSSGLDETYQTKVFGDLAKAVDWLESNS